MEKPFRKDVVIGLTVIFGSLAVASGVLAWLIKDIDDRVNKIADKRGLIAQQTGLSATIASLKKERAEAQKYLLIFNKIVPGKDDLFTFPKWIDNFSKNYGVGMSFSFSGEEVEPTESSLGYASFKMSLSGSLDKIQLFLKDLEARADTFLIGIDSYSVKITENGHNVSLEGRVYYK